MKQFNFDENHHLAEQDCLLMFLNDEGTDKKDKINNDLNNIRIMSLSIKAYS